MEHYEQKQGHGKLSTCKETIPKFCGKTSIGNRKKKMWNITQSLKSEIMPFSATWMDLETVILTEVI